MANRLVLGAVDGSYKLKVSKPGYDVMTALQNKQLAFSTDWNEAGNIIAIGSVALSGDQVQMPFAGFSERLTVLAMCKVGTKFIPLNTLSCLMNGEAWSNHRVGLRGDLDTIGFYLQGAGSSIVYYVVMENQFGA